MRSLSGEPASSFGAKATVTGVAEIAFDATPEPTAVTARNLTP